MKENDSEKIRQMVRDRYAQAAGGGPCGCQAGPVNACCGSSTTIADSMSQVMGYSNELILNIYLANTTTGQFIITF